MPKASSLGSFAWSRPVMRCEKWIKKEKLSERSEFFSFPFFASQHREARRAWIPLCWSSAPTLSLLTFFGEAKKVSGCRAAPGKPRLIEERKTEAT